MSQRKIKSAIGKLRGESVSSFIFKESLYIIKTNICYVIEYRAHIANIQPYLSHISDDLKSKSPLEAYVFHCLLHENHILTFQ